MYSISFILESSLLFDLFDVIWYILLNQNLS